MYVFLARLHGNCPSRRLSKVKMTCGGCCTSSTQKEGRPNPRKVRTEATLLFRGKIQGRRTRRLKYE